MNYFDESVKLHKKLHGKIELKNKVDLNSTEDLSLAYTPGVGQVSVEISKNPELAKEYTLKHNTIAVVTDGSAVLGYGNLGGLAAIPVMEGKAALFKRFAGLDAFPICLNTQDPEEIIQAVKNIAPVFGGINLEDIAAPKCFEIERRLRQELDIPVLHDDQHGTATVVLAALINVLKLTGKEKNTAKVVVNGAGAAGVAIVELMIKYGFRDIVVCDTQGIIFDKRAGLTEIKANIASRTNIQGLTGDLSVAMKDADIFIGVSKANTVTPDMVKSMNDRSAILAMANPIPEIMPDVAKSAGAFIVATGRSDFPNQINNVLAFPGIFRGALDNRVRTITDEMLISAAENLANLVKDLSIEKIMPAPFDEGVVDAVARAIK